MSNAKTINRMKEPNLKIKRRKVTFSLQAKEADRVVLVGDFNNWDPKVHPMKNAGDGMWSKTVMIPAGTYEYKFLVDGTWCLDPRNAQTCPNCFGTYNNICDLIEA